MEEMTYYSFVLRRTIFFLSKEKVDKRQSISQTQAESVDYESVMTIHIKVEEPDIVLVEDLNNIDTSCIFLHVSLISSCAPKITKFYLLNVGTFGY